MARVTTLILVHTDDGRVGIGSAYSHPGLVYLLVHDQFAPLLRGKDPTQVKELWELMSQQQAKPRLYAAHANQTCVGSRNSASTSWRMSNCTRGW